MEVIKRYNQYRRDLKIDLKCEACGAEQTDKGAYDDRNFWDNVVPDMHCESCGKSSNDLGVQPGAMRTKYPEGMQV